MDAWGERLSRLDKVETILLRVHDKGGEGHGLGNCRRRPQGLADVAREISRGICHLRLGARGRETYLAGWRPLQAPTQPESLLASCKDFLAYKPERAVEGKGRARRREAQRVFEFVVDDLVLPALRSALVNGWDVGDADPALELVEATVMAGVGNGAVQTSTRASASQRREDGQVCGPGWDSWTS